MRSITIADPSDIAGVVIDVEETLEEAITWAEAAGLHVTGSDSQTVHVKETVEECDGCSHHTFITLKQPTYHADGSVDQVFQFCFLCVDVADPHTEHFESMMKEINE